MMGALLVANCIFFLRLYPNDPSISRVIRLLPRGERKAFEKGWDKGRDCWKRALRQFVNRQLVGLFFSQDGFQKLGGVYWWSTSHTEYCGSAKLRRENFGLRPGLLVRLTEHWTWMKVRRAEGQKARYRHARSSPLYSLFLRVTSRITV